MNNTFEYKSITEQLFEMRDEQYRDFQAKLIPNIDKNLIIGVRSPKLREYAKYVYKNMEYQVFLDNVPHTYYDENNLHMYIIAQIKEYDKCVEEIEKFLPYIDNWATCDMGLPKSFAKNKNKLLFKVKEWINSDSTYAIRYGVGVLMRLFLDEDFDIEYAKIVSEIKSEEYYVKMMIAWYFATALAKQYKQIIPFLENNKMEIWTHNKTIQKACESNRITLQQKVYLRTLKR